MTPALATRPGDGRPGQAGAGGLSLLRGSIIAAATGFGAGSTLLLATVGAARAAEGVTPGLAATAQAVGVFAGTVFAARVSAARTEALTSRVAFAIAIAACLMLTQGAPAAAPAALLLGALGFAVGFSVASLDRRVAGQEAGKAASSVLYLGLSGAVGVMVTPLLLLLPPGPGGHLFLAPAIAFAAALFLWKTGSAAAGETPEPYRALGGSAGPLILLAFIFGFIDNGALSLAPAFFAGQGASNLTVSIIGIAAVAGAAIVQLAAIARAEKDAAPGRPWLLFVCLTVVAGGLFALAVSRNVAVNAVLLVVVGVAVDIVYGLGLLMHLKACPATRIGKAAAAYVSAAALGEVLGPLILDLVRNSAWEPVFFVLPGLLAIAGLVVTVRAASRADDVRAAGAMA